jgi:hypothetical protein
VSAKKGKEKNPLDGMSIGPFGCLSLINLLVSRSDFFLLVLHDLFFQAFFGPASTAMSRRFPSTGWRLNGDNFPYQFSVFLTFPSMIDAPSIMDWCCLHHDSKLDYKWFPG